MLKKEDLIALGLTEEQANKIVEDQKDYIPRSRLKEETDTIAELKKQLEERAADLTKLQGEAGKGSDLEKKLADLQTQYKVDTDTLNKQLSDARLDAALDMALSKAKARDPVSVKAHIKRDALKLKEDGSVEGLDIETLTKEKPYLFEIEQTTDEGNGFAGGSGDTGKAEPKTMTDAVAAYYRT